MKTLILLALILLALILAATTSFAGSVSYDYDKAGRLTEAKFETGGFISYKLDAGGNIEQQDSASTPEPCLFIIYYLSFIIYYRRKI